MNAKTLLRRFALAFAAALAVFAAPLMAQETYPSRTVRIVIGFAPGSGTDLAARMPADAMVYVDAHDVGTALHDLVAMVEHQHFLDQRKARLRLADLWLQRMDARRERRSGIGRLSRGLCEAYPERQDRNRA